jgi:hypothetical protein
MQVVKQTSSRELKGAGRVSATARESAASASTAGEVPDAQDHKRNDHDAGHSGEQRVSVVAIAAARGEEEKDWYERYP